MGTTPMALVADIGATNARFATTDRDGSLSEVVTLPCRDFEGPVDAVHAYRWRSGLTGQTRGCLAVAGPARGDRIELTNNHWRFSVREVGEALGLDPLVVVNDFAALARALPSLSAQDTVKLGRGEPDPQGARALIGPGSGLGVSSLVRTDTAWKAVSGEGGFVSLAPITDREVELWRIIRERHGRVSAERILSGPGLIELYAAVREAAGREPELASSEAITRRALEGTCDDCVETLAAFCRFLGSVAGDLALTVGATGGVYLGGGIMPAILPALDAEEFRRRFEAKGRMTRFVTGIPTYAITARAPALLGCLTVLADTNARG